MYNSNAYKKISQYYGSRVAERSQMPLINHINEGLKILDYFGVTDLVKDAFCLHPMLQNDADLKKNHNLAYGSTPTTMMYVMEYRNIANQSLSDIVIREPHYGGIRGPYLGLVLIRPIKLSPINEVNIMLIADKVQNYKDFIKYHKGKHARSDELNFYFQEWLEALNVSNDLYQDLTRLIDGY